MRPPPPRPTLFPYTTLFRSPNSAGQAAMPAAQTHKPIAASRAGDAAAIDCPKSVRDWAGRRLCQLLSERGRDRKSTRLNSSHLGISYAVFCLKKKKQNNKHKGSRTSGEILTRATQAGAGGRQRQITNSRW